MSSFITKALLPIRSPIFQFKRFRGKINIQRPRAPHYERAKVIKLTEPYYEEKEVNHNCFQKSKFQLKEEIVNPYNIIIAREVLNWINHSKMIGVFHLNSINADDIFKVRVSLHKENIHLKSYGKKIMKLALDDTKYEALLPLFDGSFCIVFSPELKIKQLIRITKRCPQLVLLAGVAQDTLMSRNEFINFSQLPDLQTVQAQFVNTLNMAAGQLVSHLETHQKMLCNVLDVHAKKLEENQRTPAEETIAAEQPSDTK